MKRLPFFALLVSLAAFGTTLLAVDLPGLSRSADLIVTGTVVSSTARLTADGHKIVTDTEIKVTEVLKGELSGPLIVIQPGGIVGDLGQRVEGTAPFRDGEAVLLFLDKRGTARFTPTAMAQGKFRLELTSDGRETWAMPEGDAGGMLLDPVTRAPSPGALKAMPLAQLKREIATALQPPAAVPGSPGKPIAPRGTK